DKCVELPAQSVGRVVVVVKVDFDLTIARAAQIGDRLDELEAILLFRVEKGVPRRDAVGVPVATGERWVRIRPSANPVDRGGFVGPGGQGLVVIDESEYDVHRAGEPGARQLTEASPMRKVWP